RRQRERGLMLMPELNVLAHVTKRVIPRNAAIYSIIPSARASSIVLGLLSSALAQRGLRRWLRLDCATMPQTTLKLSVLAAVLLSAGGISAPTQLLLMCARNGLSTVSKRRG